MASKYTSYVSFTRKYRPKSFKELLGQEVLVKTLSYCVINDQLAAALLLNGTRGIGKTSAARIIAKSINCTSLLTDQFNNIITCELCQSCKSFNENNHPDVLEMDAASRTGVDDIREIIESSEYRPLIGKYKVFIIDEIHMLSKSAFNALLKLIEEPPCYIKFIFATTEVQKVPLTVLSRCQRYNLRRLSVEENVTLLESIAQKEKLKYEHEVLKVIALKSEGSVRDAIGILEQVSSYVYYNSTDTHLITSESVNRMLGFAQIGTVINLIALIVDDNAKDALSLLSKVYLDSSSLECFVEQVTDFLANLIKRKIVPIFEDYIYKSYETEIEDLLKKITLSRLSLLWQIFVNGSSQIKYSHNELLTIEMLVIKAIYSCTMPDIESLLSGYEEVRETTLKHNNSKNNIKKENNSIFDFLRFCSVENENELYSLLLNEVEVHDFSNPSMEIAVINEFNQEEILKLMLLKWSGNDWRVLISKQDSIRTLKQKLTEEVEGTKDFTIIKNKFPNAKVSDIILKK